MDLNGHPADQIKVETPRAADLKETISPCGTIVSQPRSHLLHIKSYPPITSVTHLGSGVQKEKEMPKKDACGKCEYGSWVMSPILKKMVYCCDYKDGCRRV